MPQTYYGDEISRPVAVGVSTRGDVHRSHLHPPARRHCAVPRHRGGAVPVRAGAADRAGDAQRQLAARARRVRHRELAGQLGGGQRRVAAGAVRRAGRVRRRRGDHLRADALHRQRHGAGRDRERRSPHRHRLRRPHRHRLRHPQGLLLPRRPAALGVRRRAARHRRRGAVRVRARHVVLGRHGRPRRRGHPARHVERACCASPRIATSPLRCSSSPRWR